MSTVGIYDPSCSGLTSLSDFHLLQLSRPTHKAHFTRRGYGDVQLLVYLDEHNKIPFIRVPLETLLEAVQQYERSQN